MRQVALGLAVLISAAAAHAQPAPAPANPEAKLVEALGGWEKAAGALANVGYSLALKRTNPTFPNAPRLYSGSVLCMKPGFARLRLKSDADKSGNDYEAFICDGKKVYEYNGLQKTVTEWKLPDPKQNPAGATDNLLLDLVAGMNAKAARARFDITFKAEDKDYLYLNVKPKLAKDKAEFLELRLALYHPNTKWAHLPAGVYLVKPSGDAEDWWFADPRTNVAGIDEKVFQFEKVDGFRFVEGKPPAPAAPAAPRPGVPKLPGGERP